MIGWLACTVASGAAVVSGETVGADVVGVVSGGCVAVAIAAGEAVGVGAAAGGGDVVSLTGAGRGVEHPAPNETTMATAQRRVRMARLCAWSFLQYVSVFS